MDLPGPRMAASMSVTFSSLRKTLMPSGGVWTSSCSSMVMRLITFGERFSTDDYGENWGEGGKKKMRFSEWMRYGCGGRRGTMARGGELR